MEAKNNRKNSPMIVLVVGLLLMILADYMAVHDGHFARFPVPGMFLNAFPITLSGSLLILWAAPSLLKHGAVCGMALCNTACLALLGVRFGWPCMEGMTWVLLAVASLAIWLARLARSRSQDLAILIVMGTGILSVIIACAIWGRWGISSVFRPSTAYFTLAVWLGAGLGLERVGRVSHEPVRVRESAPSSKDISNADSYKSLKIALVLMAIADVLGLVVALVWRINLVSPLSIFAAFFLVVWGITQIRSTAIAAVLAAANAFFVCLPFAYLIAAVYKHQEARGLTGLIFLVACLHWVFVGVTILSVGFLWHRLVGRADEGGGATG